MASILLRTSSKSISHSSWSHLNTLVSHFCHNKAFRWVSGLIVYPYIELRELVEGSDEDGQFLVQYTTVEFEDKSIELSPDQRTLIESTLKELGIGGKRWLKRSRSLATAPEHSSSHGKSLRNRCTDATRTSLELLLQTSDIFPPLKSAVGGVLALWDLVEVNAMHVWLCTFLQLSDSASRT